MIFIYGILFIIAGVLVYALMSERNKKVDSKLDDAISFSNKKEEEIEKPLTKREIRYQLMDIELIRAGIPLKAHEFERIRLISIVLVLGMLYFLTKNYVVAIIFTIVWSFVPKIIIKIAQERKKVAMEEQIPVALSLIRNSLEAGFSFLQALEVVAEEMEPPVSEEFAKVLHETQVGKDLEIALNNMLHRTPSDELKLVVIAVLIQRQVGGNLGEIIDIILETIKDRIQIKGEIKTLTSQGRLSAMIICGLPAVLAAIMYVINPTYMIPLFTTFMGQVLLGVAGALELLGVYMISRIIKIDF